MKKIAITGPESTGKTTLSQQLATEFNTVYVPEFARDYIAQLGRQYKYEDVIYIAEQQLNLETGKAKEASELLFCDTDLLVIRVWLLDKFGEVPDWIESYLSKNPYDLYLLMAPDLPWQEDALREDAERLDHLFDQYLQFLKHQSVPFQIIRGKGKLRLENAVKTVNEELN